MEVYPDWECTRLLINGTDKNRQAEANNESQVLESLPFISKNTIEGKTKNDKKKFICVRCMY